MMLLYFIGGPGFGEYQLTEYLCFDLIAKRCRTKQDGISAILDHNTFKFC